MTTEIAPTERCAYFRFTFPETSDAYVVIDAFDRGSYVKVIPEENKIVGYTTRNSGGVPQNFKNYFVIEFDKPFTFNKVWADYHLVETHLELQSNHVGAAIGFSTKKGEQVHAKSGILIHQPRTGGTELEGKLVIRLLNRQKRPVVRHGTMSWGVSRLKTAMRTVCVRSTLACIVRCCFPVCFTR